MSMLHTTEFTAQPVGRLRHRKRAAPIGWRGASLRRLRQLLRAFRRHIRSRRDLRQVLELDDRALADIGLTRVEFLRPTSQSFWW